MKTCYMCKGEIELSLVDVEVKGVVVKDVPAEVCTRCGEKYFDIIRSARHTKVAVKA